MVDARPRRVPAQVVPRACVKEIAIYALPDDRFVLVIRRRWGREVWTFEGRSIGELDGAAERCGRAAV